MIIYLKSINFDLWDIVVNGYISSKKNYNKWNDDEKKLANILLCYK